MITSNASKRVCIATPICNRPTFTEDEMLSFKHLERFLGHYDRYLIAPEGLDLSLDGFSLKRFGSEYFGSGAAHTRLMLSPGLYEAFRDYEYVLIYHTDALVFSDQLEHWCDKGYDYIAPPWISHPDAPYHGFVGQEGLVGNGGFSLRKTSSFLKVLRSDAYAIHPVTHWKKYYASKSLATRILNSPKFFLLWIKSLNNIRYDVKKMKQNEDYFWVHRGRHYYPDFRVATVEEALPFAFECVPSYCFEKNGNRLPFGCHAWQKYDRSFWEPYLLK